MSRWHRVTGAWAARNRAGRFGRRPALAAVGAGAVLIVLGTRLLLVVPAASAPDLAATRAGPSTGAQVISAGSAPQVPSATPRSTTSPLQSPSPDTAASAPIVTALPVRLELPAQHVQVSVVPIGVTAQRGLEPPADPAVVGWFSGSALPGEPTGRTLLTGHLDTLADGPGALATLLDVHTGDPVQLTGADGTTRNYRITSRTFYDKATLPPQVFAVPGPPGLLLVTCGGPFDERTHNYRDNIVVTAEPA